MKAGVTRLGILGSSLIVLCAILIVVISRQLYQGPSAVRADGYVVATAPGPASPPLPGAAISFPPLRQYAEVVERPLFEVSRRPPPPEAKATSVAAKELRQLILTGVVITPDKNLAIFRDKNPSDIMRLEQGMAVDEWSLDEIRADGVTFRKGAATHELLLHEEKDDLRAANIRPRRGMRRRRR